VTVISDDYWMRRALRLAALGRHASPNPMVGCVIVDPSGCKVGEGYHHEPGLPHAEVNALHQAGARARLATAYVTLEPCSHHGRTPPCVDALIASGVGRVVIAMTDPDIRVSGRGIDRLEASGVETVIGVLQAQANSLNRAYIHHRVTGLPWVTVKVATTLDGKIATESGDSRWITGAITRRWVHRQLRDRSDAILVGVNTVLRDDPRLTTRLSRKPGRNPLRVVLDSHLRTPSNAKIVGQATLDGKTIIACLPDYARSHAAEWADRGVRLVPIKPDNSGTISLYELLSTLGTSHAVSTVLVEGGSRVIGSFVRNGLVNRYITTIGPKLIGGKSGIGPVGGTEIASTMKEAVRLSIWKMRKSASDIVIDAFLAEN
jgi:diaminohydroxyphosphoribosylaminopyrimidine deaminase/5-amino-6-(5-phosphoribosylamino)uracil reductase